MAQSIEQLSGAVEALLFVYGEAMDVKKIAKVLGADKKQVEEAIEQLVGRYQGDGGGLQLIRQNAAVQLATKPQFSAALEDFMKSDFTDQLTPAALETLSLVLYLGPISRNQLDFYRGVNSRFMLRSLLIRGLVERVSDSEKSGTTLYCASMDLLRHLGVSRVEELPDYGLYREKLSVFPAPSSSSSQSTS